LRARPSTLCDPTSGFMILCIALGLAVSHSQREALPRNVVTIDDQSSEADEGRELRTYFFGRPRTMIMPAISLLPFPLWNSQ